MTATGPTFTTRAFAIAFVVLLVAPMGAAATTHPLARSESADAGVEFVRTSEEVRGYLLASTAMAADGNTDAAGDLAAEPAAEHWAILGPALREANASLAESLQADLERLPAMADNRSAAEYEQFVRETVFPQLTAAETAVVGHSTAENATFNARVVRDLLERSVHEYREGVSNGSVSDEGAYRVAQSFADRAEVRYEATIAGTVSDHANEAVTDLFGHLDETMAAPGATDDVERYVDSLTAELAEYTGIENDQSGSAAAIGRIEGDLDEAVAAYEAGNHEQAKSIVQQTYVSNFEGLEGTLIQENPELVGDLEAAFNDDLPKLIDDNASASEVRDRVEGVKENLETAEGILPKQETTSISLEAEASTTTTAATPTTAAPSTTSTNVPGFTAVGAILAFAAVGILARRS